MQHPPQKNPPLLTLPHAPHHIIAGICCLGDLHGKGFMLSSCIFSLASFGFKLSISDFSVGYKMSRNALSPVMCRTNERIVKAAASEILALRAHSMVTWCLIRFEDGDEVLVCTPYYSIGQPEQTPFSFPPLPVHVHICFIFLLMNFLLPTDKILFYRKVNSFRI